MEAIPACFTYHHHHRHHHYNHYEEKIPVDVLLSREAKKELRFKEEMSLEEVSLSLLLSNRQLLTPSETPATRDSIFVCLLMDVDSTL